MFHKVQSDKKHIFANNIKLDKKEESKTTPHVNVKVSAYDTIVQLVTNDNSVRNHSKRSKKQVRMSV